MKGFTERYDCRSRGVENVIFETFMATDLLQPPPLSEPSPHIEHIATSSQCSTVKE